MQAGCILGVFPLSGTACASPEFDQLAASAAEPGWKPQGSSRAVAPAAPGRALTLRAISQHLPGRAQIPQGSSQAVSGARGAAGTNLRCSGASVPGQNDSSRRAAERGHGPGGSGGAVPAPARQVRASGGRGPGMGLGSSPVGRGALAPHALKESAFPRHPVCPGPPRALC